MMGLRFSTPLNNGEAYIEDAEWAGLERGANSMDAFIYTFERLPCGIDELEDALDPAFGSRGEVTGTGTGPAGCNLDVFIEDGAISEEQVLLLIRRVLADHRLPGMTRVVIDGREHTLA